MKPGATVCMVWDKVILLMEKTNLKRSQRFFRVDHMPGAVYFVISSFLTTPFGPQMDMFSFYVCVCVCAGAGGGGVSSTLR